jgi:glycosyltransferase 2 family protein
MRTIKTMLSPSLPPSMIRALKLFLKIGFVGGVFYFLSQKNYLSFEATKRALWQWDKIIPAISLLFLTTFISMIRWHWLLSAQNIQIKFSRTAQLVFIGSFFNIALPGAVSGDFVKAFYVGKEIHGKKAPAFSSIVFDRVAGLSALVLVSAGALLAEIGYFLGTPLFTAIRVFVILSALAVLIFFSYLFLVREHHDPLLHMFRSIERYFPKIDAITRIYAGLRHYHNHRWLVLKSLGISVVTHLSVCLACILFANALGDSQISWLPIFVVVPLGLLVTAIPITPAGVGTGHVAFSGLFHLIGSERGADIFNLYILVQLLGACIGGLVYLRFRSHEPGPMLTKNIEPATELDT